MLNMSQINDIREKVKAGYSISEIARELGVDEKTIRKYRDQHDYSPKVPIIKEHPSKLDPFKATIDQWLEEDRKRWYKQKHTAKRMHDRLQAEYPESYDCSYNLVHRYVRVCRQDEQRRRGVLELEWPAGQAQVDFGEADFYERGVLIRKKYLTVSFPYSNDGFSQVFGGETAECVCQGLKDIFAYIGGVPTLLVFDNATGVGRRVGEVIRETELFQRMRAHYNFSVRFCNPHAGQEKGHVENKVGYNRRNLFVPVPAYDDSYESKSLILTTNLEFSKWGSIFTDEQMAAAMIDRLVHHGHLIMFEGKSYRMEHALMRQSSRKTAAAAAQS